MKFKMGDYVRVVTREQTPADVKNGTFYPFFCGLEGTVDKVYDEAVCIKVEYDTLPADVLKRHTEIQDSIKRKWLDNLSGEARNRLTPEEKRFELAYTLLIQEVDLEKAKLGAARPAAVQPAKPAAEAKPVTSKDLTQAEAQFLEERKKALENQ